MSEKHTVIHPHSSYGMILYIPQHYPCSISCWISGQKIIAQHDDGKQHENVLMCDWAWVNSVLNSHWFPRQRQNLTPAVSWWYTSPIFCLSTTLHLSFLLHKQHIFKPNTITLSPATQYPHNNHTTDNNTRTQWYDYWYYVMYHEGWHVLCLTAPWLSQHFCVVFKNQKWYGFNQRLLEKCPSRVWVLS